jgi:hypothetical protein
MFTINHSFIKVRMYQEIKGGEGAPTKPSRLDTQPWRRPYHTLIDGMGKVLDIQQRHTEDVADIFARLGRREQ